jgi:two-component system sensor histidine kinase EvgS
MIDELRVQQILINLIQNAIKFSEKESVIIVTIVTNMESKTKVNSTISVEDTGIGISPLDLERLFNPYFKTSDEKSKQVNQGSHGLGLHISKRIA